MSGLKLKAYLVAFNSFDEAALGIVGRRIAIVRNGVSGLAKGSAQIKSNLPGLFVSGELESGDTALGFGERDAKSAK